MTELAARAARHMFDERKARATFHNLPDGLRPGDEAGVYAIQDGLHTLLQNNGAGARAGYKIALSTATMQKMLGADRPCMGALFANSIWPSPCTLGHSDYLHLGMECEVAVRLGADLVPGDTPFTRASVAPAVAACHAAFEVIDDRDADYGASDAYSLIADNCWNAGVVLGPEVSDWQSIDFDASRGSLLVNGNEVASGLLSDAMGHPFEALAWLANLMAERGLMIEHGTLVMTGSIVPTTFVKPGDQVTYQADNLGEVTAKII